MKKDQLQLLWRQSWWWQVAVWISIRVCKSQTCSMVLSLPVWQWRLTLLQAECLGLGPCTRGSQSDWMVMVNMLHYVILNSWCSALLMTQHMTTESTAHDNWIHGLWTQIYSSKIACNYASCCLPRCYFPYILPGRFGIHHLLPMGVRFSADKVSVTESLGQHAFGCK